MKEIKPIKIALLSLNHGHGKAYYDLKNDPFFELVAASVEPDYRDKIFIERLSGIPLYDTDEELYENHPELEAVIVASANVRHYEQTKDAFARGLHVFSMKVPTFDMEQYDELIALKQQKGLVCAVELEMRHHTELLRVRELVRSGAVGELLSINMLNYSHNPVWWRPWQCDPTESFGKKVPLWEGAELYRGGALADHPHIFDCVRFITGSDFDTVHAKVAPNIRDEVQTEDLIRVMGRLKNGVIFSLDPSYANNENRVDRQINWERYPRCVEVTLNLVGTKGTVIADLYGRAFSSQRDEGGFYLSSGPAPVGIWNRRMHEFYDAVREGIEPPVTLESHRHTVEAMVAAYDSLTLGKAVKL